MCVHRVPILGTEARNNNCNSRREDARFLQFFRRNGILRPKLPYLTGRQGIRSARLKKAFRAAKELAAFT